MTTYSLAEMSIISLAAIEGKNISEGEISLQAKKIVENAVDTRREIFEEQFGKLPGILYLTEDEKERRKDGVKLDFAPNPKLKNRK